MKITTSIFSLFQFLQLSIFAQCYTLAWSDEFNYSGLPDPNKWGYDVMKPYSVNNELQNYVYARAENSRVENGNLVLEARRDYYQGYEYSSARLTNKWKGDFLYGKIEVRAKVPAGRGTWPAIWCLPTDKAYGGWPNSGELDIMEYVGYRPNVVQASVHTAEKNFKTGGNWTEILNNSTVEEAFHIYRMEWFNDHIEFFVDNTKVGTYYNENRGSTQWPFDKRHFLLLNLAIGGDWGGLQGVDNTIFPCRMEIDYVRIYSMNTSPSNTAPYSGSPATIPGTIEAENFDKGCPNVAYYDRDTINQGSAAYRKEGVDIETCTEGGYNVGYTDGSEWLNYTINVATAGSYGLDARVAALPDGGRFHFKLNGVKFTDTVHVGSTGGWQNWKTIPVGIVQLPAGTSTIKYVVEKGGFNLNYFTLSSITDVEEKKSLHYSIYPNPMTEEIVNIALGDKSCTIGIYDLSGKLLFQKTMSGTNTENLNFLARGIYLLKVSNNEATNFQKLIVQ